MNDGQKNNCIRIGNRIINTNMITDVELNEQTKQVKVFLVSSGDGGNSIEFDASESIGLWRWFQEHSILILTGAPNAL